MIEFKINNYITLKLENEATKIYVNKEEFDQCKYLLFGFNDENYKHFENIRSIDEVTEQLDHSLELPSNKTSKIPPETEFWGHCSNLQAWAENNYDTRLLHSNLSFPLLKKLTEAGDPTAKKYLKKRLQCDLRVFIYQLCFIYLPKVI